MGGGGDTSTAARYQAQAMERAAQLSSDASRYATDAQTRAHDEDMQRYQQMYDTTREDTAGQRHLGQQAIGSLSRELGEGGFLRDRFDGADLEDEAGYQFRLAEGQKAVNRSAAAGGGLLSGAAAKAMGRYSQDYASNEYQNAYNRFSADQDRTYNMLMGASNLGAAASGAGTNIAQSMSQVNQGYANNVGAIATANASNQGNLAMQQGNLSAQQAMQPSKGQRAVGGAATGAMAGMAFGPWGAVIGGALGALTALF